MKEEMDSATSNGSEKKRPRPTAREEGKRATLHNSRIFQPFRAIGYVTSNVPFVLLPLGTEYFLIVAVGNAFQIYDCAHFHLKSVGSVPSPNGNSIQALAAVDHYTFAAHGNRITRFLRGHADMELGGEFSLFILYYSLVS
jgi:U3 small nucleolar RNA-associated protein 21